MKNTVFEATIASGFGADFTGFRGHESSGVQARRRGFGRAMRARGFGREREAGKGGERDRVRYQKILKDTKSYLPNYHLIYIGTQCIGS